MKRLLGVVLLLAAIAVVVHNIQRTESRLSESIEQLNRQKLEQAVAMAQAGLETIVHHGSGEWTPSKAAARFVKLNAAGEFTPEQAAQARQAGALIEYHEAQVFGPWQVAIVPDESRRLIRIEGYGADVTKPLFVREVRCP